LDKIMKDRDVLPKLTKELAAKRKALAPVAA
jgi:hypothetical protein